MLHSILTTHSYSKHAFDIYQEKLAFNSVSPLG